MTGADAIVRTLLQGGVEVCFTNPGTTELHFMAALDRNPGMRAVLGLFEGVVTGAADGYARMADRPAATLLHLGPGFANGIANLHNARRALSPMVNIIGDHPDSHLPLDPPLTSDIARLAQPVSAWIRRVRDERTAAEDAAAALAAARMPPGAIASLIVPADVAWQEAAGPAITPPTPRAGTASPDAVRTALAALRRPEPALLILGGFALRDEGLQAAARIAAATGCELLAQTSNARLERGVGRPSIERVPYAVDQAMERLAPFRTVILAGALEPVAFFAYPGRPGRLLQADAAVGTLARPGDDVVGALEWLADELGAPPFTPPSHEKPAAPQGRLTRDLIGEALAFALPDDAIVADESITTGRRFFATTHGARPHTWLQLTGGAIGIGMPLATGAAIACPERPVLTLQADGSGMYTLQALWTQAREGLRITNVILANRAYAILKAEMRGADGIEVGAASAGLMELRRPDLDWVSLGRGMGVEGERVETAEDLVLAIQRGIESRGPYLVEALF